MSATVRAGYKQTQAGTIPLDWRIELLGRIGQWFSGGTPSLSNELYWSGDIPWVSPKDMKLPRLSDAIDHISSKAVVDGARVLPVGAVLMVIRGMILAHSFPVARVESPLAFNQDIKAVVPRADIDSNYVLYWLMAHKQHLRGLITESTHGTKRLPTEALFRQEFCLPPLPEQRAIAAALSDVDALLAKLDALVAKKRDLKQAVMQQLITGQTRLPGFSGEWEMIRLGNCLLARPDYGINAPAVAYSDLLPTYVRITDITDDGRFSPEKLTSVASANSPNYYLSEGDIVFARTGASVGKSYRYKLSDGELVFAGFLIRVRPDQRKLLPAFLTAYVATDAYWSWVGVMSMRSGQPGINGNEFAQLRLPVPTLEEQTAIATIFSDMDAELVALEARRDKTRALKQGMMQELLTGRLRLV